MIIDEVEHAIWKIWQGTKKFDKADDFFEMMSNVSKVFLSTDRSKLWSLVMSIMSFQKFDNSSKNLTRQKKIWQTDDLFKMMSSFSNSVLNIAISELLLLEILDESFEKFDKAKQSLTKQMTFLRWYQHCQFCFQIVLSKPMIITSKRS